jgi:RNA polymerase sigma-70 factor, ECF subfamily
MPMSHPFEDERESLVRHAYRMLGSMYDAEDVVQDAYLRWQRDNRENVRNPRAYLRATVTHLALDRLRAVKRSRETYVGPWLPEPIMTDEAASPEHAVTIAEDVSFAFLLALERLSPLERAAFLLHDALDVPFAEIAQTLERSEESVRRLASRARHAIRQSAPRRIEPRADGNELRARFTDAIRSGDVAQVTALLTQDVILLADGGGKKPAAMRPIVGHEDVARLLAGLGRIAKSASFEVHPATVNGLPGMVISGENGVIEGAWALETRGDRIGAIYIMRNPDKLGVVSRVTGLPVR